MRLDKVDTARVIRTHSFCLILLTTVIFSSHTHAATNVPIADSKNDPAVEIAQNDEHREFTFEDVIKFLANGQITKGYAALWDFAKGDEAILQAWVKGFNPGIPSIYFFPIAEAIHNIDEQDARRWLYLGMIRLSQDLAICGLADLPVIYILLRQVKGISISGLGDQAPYIDGLQWALAQRDQPNAKEIFRVSCELAKITLGLVYKTEEERKRRVPPIQIKPESEWPELRREVRASYENMLRGMRRIDHLDQNPELYRDYRFVTRCNAHREIGTTVANVLVTERENTHAKARKSYKDCIMLLHDSDVRRSDFDPIILNPESSKSEAFPFYVECGNSRKSAFKIMLKHKTRAAARADLLEGIGTCRLFAPESEQAKRIISKEEARAVSQKKYEEQKNQEAKKQQAQKNRVAELAKPNGRPYLHIKLCKPFGAISYFTLVVGDGKYEQALDHIEQLAYKSPYSRPCLNFLHDGEKFERGDVVILDRAKASHQDEFSYDVQCGGENKKPFTVRIKHDDDKSARKAIKSGSLGNGSCNIFE